MIITNGVPKSGNWLLVNYLQGCGLKLEPGGLMAYHAPYKLRMVGGKPWGKSRTLEEILADKRDDRVLSGHFADSVDLPGHRVAFIYRNPRNVLVSYARWHAVNSDWTNKTRSQPAEAAVRKHFGSNWFVNIMNMHRVFHGWLEKADVAVRFEDFQDWPEEVGHRISDALDIPFCDPREVMCENAPWVSSAYQGTWSGKHSDWREWWDNELEALWHRHGGPEIEESYGYGRTAYKRA